MAFATTSCDRTENMPRILDDTGSEITDNVKYTGDYVTLSFTASENKVRSMLPIEDKSSANTTSVKIRWEKDKEYDIKCVLYNKKNPDQTSFQNIKAVVTNVNPNGTATIRYKGTIQLANGSLAGGEWYMQLLMGLDEKYWDASTKSYRLDKRLISDNINNTLDIPIGSPWVKLDVNTAGKHVAAPAVRLDPMGVIFALEIESPLCDPMTFKRIELDTSLFNGTGTFKLGNFTNEGDMPSFEADKVKIWEYSTKTNFDLNYDMPANYTSQKPQTSRKIYFWAMPRKVVSSDIKGKLFVSYDNDEYGLPISESHYSGPVMTTQTTQTIKMRIQESDLMISEFYHYNYGEAIVSKPRNFSMIEIYNPTCRSIDLTKYSIIRQRTIKSIDTDLIPVSGFQPTDDVHDIQDALRQDIYIEVKNSPSKVVDGREARNVSPHCTNAINRYYLISGTYDKMLPPGKTVVLCAGGTYKIYNDSGYSSWNEYPVKQVGNYIEKAKKDGIHYMIAVDNGSTENAFQYQRSGGVMQHGRLHVMILMKGEKPIDVTGPFTYRNRNGAKPNDINQLATKQMLENYNNFTGVVPAFTTESDWSNLIRKNWDFYPSPYWDNNKKDGNWDKDSRWILITGEGAGGTELSSWGTRYPKKGYFDYDFINRTRTTVVYYPVGINN